MTSSQSRTPWAAALLSAGLLALAGIIGATFWLSRQAQIYSDAVLSVRDLRVSAVELRNGLLTAESSQRGYLFSGNEIYLAPFDSAKATAMRMAEDLKQLLPRYPQFRPMVNQLSTLVEAKIAEMEETISLKRSPRDEEAMDLFLTNRGKSLMDQTNVFVTGLIEAADGELIDGVHEQSRNAEMMRIVSIAGGVLIVIVVSGAIAAFVRTARDIAAARDAVRVTNETLELRVEERTSALKAALSTAETLMAEVNHRVANSLSLVGSLVRLQGAASKQDAVKSALNETEARIAAIASVHKRLYRSGDVGLVELDQYLAGLLDSLAATMRAEGRGGRLTYDLDEAQLTTDASINVGVAVTELVTNAYKYAYPTGSGEIRVRLKHVPESRVEIVVEDDGIGRGSGAPAGTGVGTRIVKAMAATLGTEIQYRDRRPGTAAILSVSISQ